MEAGRRVWLLAHRRPLSEICRMSAGKSFSQVNPEKPLSRFANCLSLNTYCAILRIFGGYSADFRNFAVNLSTCGEIGRRARLRIW